MSIKNLSSCLCSRILSSIAERGFRGEVLALLFFIFLIGCTEDVDLTVTGGEKQVVIEGSIENGQPAKVIITRNSPLSQAIDVNSILVTNAKVYVSNGSVTDTLVL